MLIILKTNNIYAQKTVNLDTIENTIYLGKFKLKTPHFLAVNINTILKQIHIFIH